MKSPRICVGMLTAPPLAALLLAAPLLAGCGAASTQGSAAGSAVGRVTGRLVMEGGPIGPGGQQPGVRPIPGIVTFTVAGRQPVSVEVGNSGRFALRLPPGEYHVSGRTPRIIEAGNGAGRERPCSQPMTVTVAADHTATIAVTCIVP